MINDEFERVRAKKDVLSYLLAVFGWANAASISVIITRVRRWVKWQFLKHSTSLGGLNGFILSPLQRR
jgi:hypothetical protein